MNNNIRYMLMPEIKSIRINFCNDFDNADKKIFDRKTEFYAELRYNHIKGTVLIHEDYINNIVIFDTNRDFILFKLIFYDRQDKKWAEAIMKYHNYNYEEHKKFLIKAFSNYSEYFII